MLWCNLSNFQCAKFVLPTIYKPKKTRIIKPVASLFYQQTFAMEGHKYVNGPANLRKFHRRRRDKSCSEDLDLSMRKLSNLSPFGNLPRSVFFLIDLFSRRRGPMNIKGAVSGNLSFHYIKAVLC